MFAELSDAAWTKREGLRALTNALGAENIRWVGGAIRDSLLGTDVNDVDCATKLSPDVVIDRCKDVGRAVRVDHRRTDFLAEELAYGVRQHEVAVCQPLHERRCTQAVGTVVGEVGFSNGVTSGDGGH